MVWYSFNFFPESGWQKEEKSVKTVNSVQDFSLTSSPNFGYLIKKKDREQMWHGHGMPFR